jgi:hypothetical protein
MPYKYFSQELVDKNILDLSQVFPEKQQLAKESNNVDYTLMDIVLYLKNVTEDFKFTDNRYIDLDQAIKSIVQKYYVSIGKINPFEEEEDEVLDLRLKTESGLPINPRESAIVEEGRIKGKGANKSVPLPVTSVENAKIKEFRNSLENIQELFDDSTLEEQDILMNLQKKRAGDLEFFIEDSEGEDVTIEKQKLKLLKNFISKNTK